VRGAVGRLVAAAVLAFAIAPPVAALDEVPFITTPDNVTLAMLRLAGVGPRDLVVDLGSGDGRIVIVAAQRFGARGVGIEYVPDLVRQSRDHAARAGVADRVEFRVQDLFDADLSGATVVTLYLLTEVNLQLRPRLLALPAGTRIVSHDWDMDDWRPDRTIVVEAPDKAIGLEKKSRLMLWVVPAPLQGRWCAAAGDATLVLDVGQRFQDVKGTLTSRTGTRTFDGHIDGAALTVSASAASAPASPTTVASPSGASATAARPADSASATDASATAPLVLTLAGSALGVTHAGGRFADLAGRTFARGNCDAPAAAAGAWQAAPPLLHARAAHAVVATRDAIYALAGTGRGGAPVLPVERFDGAQWRIDTTLPGPGLNAPAAVALDGRLYVIGGFATDTNVPTDRVHVYDTRTRRWSEAAPLPAPRGGHAAAVLDGRIHVIGGGNSTRTLADHDVYDPGRNAWTSAPPLPRAEGSPAAVVHRGRLYAIGGRSGPADFGNVDLYDPATMRWLDGPPIDPRGTAGAVVYCHAIHVFGGESQSRRQSLGDVLRLSPAGTWVRQPPMPTPRNFARAVVFGGDVLVIGGSPTPEPSHASEGSAVVERYHARCADAPGRHVDTARRGR
jgi:hypothetical protein